MQERGVRLPKDMLEIARQGGLRLAAANAYASCHVSVLYEVFISCHIASQGNSDCLNLLRKSSLWAQSYVPSPSSVTVCLRILSSSSRSVLSSSSTLVRRSLQQNPGEGGE